MNENSEYEIFVSGNAPRLYPTDTYFGLLYYGPDEVIEIPKLYPYSGEWGNVLSTQIHENDRFPMPRIIYMVWLSIVEQKFYLLRDRLQYKKMEKLWCKKRKDSDEKIFSHIVVGMAPFGGVAVWCCGDKKSVIEGWHQAEETEVNIQDFMGGNPNISLTENCHFYIGNDSLVKNNIEQNGLPSRHLFDNYMKQFIYRYQVLLEKWIGKSGDVRWKKYNEDEDKMPKFDFIEEFLFDGTYDKLHDEGLLEYHQAGKPKKLAIKWHIGKTEYSAYFWFEEEPIREVFNEFYGAHPDTNTDFVIRIDAENKKYELALYRYGVKEPHIISEKVYQLLVFKNNFEDYRSDNYNQECGSWIW